MSDKKEEHPVNNTDPKDKDIKEKKSFGSDVEDELTPINVRHIFTTYIKRIEPKPQAAVGEQKVSTPAPESRVEAEAPKTKGEEPRAAAEAPKIPVEPAVEPAKSTAEPAQPAVPAPTPAPSPAPIPSLLEQPQAAPMPTDQENAGGVKEEKEDFDPDIDGVFMELIDEYMPRTESVEIGDIIEAPVLEVRPDCVLVDVGDKTEGMVDIAEFMNKNADVLVSPGEIVEVMIEGRDEKSDQVVLSHRRALRKMAVERLQRATQEKIPIRGKIMDVVRGGLIVDVGIPCFMPASQLDTSRVEDLTAWVGREIEAYVLDFDLDKRRAVLSRRLLVQEDLQKRRQAILQTLKVGDVRTVRIKSILDFGAFVNLGALDGFIPREEVSHERGSHPSMFLKEDQEVKVKIIKVDRETEKVTLSRKQARLDPWTRVEDKYPVNSIITGRVVSITNFGAFVQIEEGLTGMIHVSNLSWDKGPKRPEQFMKEGDIVKAAVLELVMDNRKMSLGLKQITEDPWVTIEGKFTPGLKAKGVVTNLTDFGAFVKLDENIEGLIHISNITWDKNPQKPNKYLKLGQEVESVILKTNRDGRRISLGLKQLLKSPWEIFMGTHRVGQTVEGVITRIASFGAFVDLGEGLEGLLHVSQISPERVENPNAVLKEGEKIKCKIIKISDGGRKISLSRKELLQEEEKRLVREYLKDDVKSGVNVGDLLRQMNLKM